MDLINPRLGAIRKGVTTLRSMLKDYQKLSNEDPFLIVMEPFFGESEQKLKLLECNLVRLDKIYQEFIATWNETPQTLSLQAVFTILFAFVSDLKVRFSEFFVIFLAFFKDRFFT
jgi:hypothetical protein